MSVAVSAAAAATPALYRVLVVGASGGLGRHVVLEALRAGHTVTALVRSAAKLSAALSDHPAELAKVRVIEGEADRPNPQLQEALKDQDALLVASHLIMLPVLEAALSSPSSASTLKRVSAAGGAPILESVADGGRLAFLGLESSAAARGTPRDYATMARQHWANWSGLVLARGIDQYALVAPGYMTDQPLLPDAAIESNATTFIPHCNARPFPYANCARIMVQALQPGYPLANKRIAMSVKQQQQQ